MKKTILGLVTLFMFMPLFACGGEAKINCYSRDTTSGTRDGFFTGIGFSEAKEDDTVLTKDVVIRQKNGDIISALKNDENGIGYISLSSLANSGLKSLKYEGVAISEATVLNKTYKLTRNFNYVIRNEFDDDNVKQLVEAFVAYLGTKEASETVYSKGGILDLKKNLPSWDEIKGNYPICQKDNKKITLRFGGSTSVEEISKALSDEFEILAGNFVSEHNHTGSGDAYKRTQGKEKNGSDALDIGFASREFKVDSEPCVEGSFGLICVDAIAVVVNSKNKIDAITSEMCKKIYKGEITKWSEIE